MPAFAIADCCCRLLLLLLAAAAAAAISVTQHRHHPTSHARSWGRTALKCALAQGKKDVAAYLRRSLPTSNQQNKTLNPLVGCRPNPGVSRPQHRSTREKPELAVHRQLHGGLWPLTIECMRKGR